jgi:hypothetical protein
MYIRVVLKQRPIEPVHFVVLAVSVVVSVLRPSDFIAHQDHGKAQREQRDRHEILNLAISESLNFRIRRRPLDTAVPAPIVICAITVILAVSFVMLVIVGDEIVKRKPVMTGYEVHALLRFALFVSIDLVTAE